jgi:aspartate/methionine/tyrosine aminotransferase
VFSERTRFDRRANRLTEALEARRRRGERTIDLTVSNPTRAGILAPHAVLAPLAGEASRHYEPRPLGHPEAREAIALDYQASGLSVGAERIVLHASTSEAYGFLFKLLCDPGDDVLVPRPGYPLFEFLAGLESVAARSYALSYDGEWHLDLALLAAAIGPRTRAIVVVSPGNPTGAYLKQDEADALGRLCAERGLAVVSDEVFADFPLRPDPRRAASAASDSSALTFALGGLSKSCALPQLKLAWTAVAGPEPLRREALERLELVADTFLPVATPVQAALPSLLARKKDLSAPVRARVEGNLGTLRAALRASPATLLEPEGGWSAVLRVPATVSEEERALRLLERSGVLVHPGYFFDFPGEAYLVLSLLPEPSEFGPGLDRLLADLVL